MTFASAYYLDFAAALAALVLTVMAAVWTGREPGQGTTAQAKWSLIGTVVALGVRAAADVGLANLGRTFASRQLLVDVPLAALPVLLAFVLILRGRPSARVTGVAAAACGIALLDPLLLPGPITLAALIVAAATGPPLVLPGRAVAGVARRGLAAVAGLAAVVLVAQLGASWWQSRLPGTYDLASYAQVDTGGAPVSGQHAAGGTGSHGVAAGDHGVDAVPVPALKGPAGTPDVRVNLTAAPISVQREGRRIAAVAFNGTIPGPPIRATLGDLVLVHVCNHGDVDGVSVHWHGYDVPNAEDGVAGVTQNAIASGGCHDYRFRANQVGTYWYHAHQDSSTQVDRGLYGALVVAEPQGSAISASAAGGRSAPVGDLTVLDHAWRPPGGYLAGATWRPGENAERAVVAPGTPVRLRLVNTDRMPHRYRLTGASFRLAAVDGTDTSGATPIGADRSLLLAAGGRYDLAFTMPRTGVRLTGLGAHVSLLLVAGADGAVPAQPANPPTADLDLLSYGSSADNSAAANPSAGVPDVSDLKGTPNRDFSIVIDRRIGFSAGKVGYLWAINGKTYPRMPMLMVSQGDLVRIRLVNRTTADHPMHLHGHHVLVLSRNGRPATGAPWLTDTLNVAPGQDFVVAFRADNPGIWMDHCHDLRHAAQGFVMHLGYTGVSTPFRIGADTPNRPE